MCIIFFAYIFIIATNKSYVLHYPCKSAVTAVTNKQTRMNFSLFALASVLATTASAAAGPIRRKTFKLDNNQRTLRRGEPSTEALLKVARPYNNASSRNRRLEDGEVEIDGSYSLKFSQCVELKTKDEEMFEDENMVAYVQSGQIASTASYVLIHVCKENDCYYEMIGNFLLLEKG